MAAPLDEATRGRIYAMFHRNVPTRVIVEETGVSKTTINAMRKAWKEQPEKTPVRADGHACDYKDCASGQVGTTEPTGRTDGPLDRDGMAVRAKEAMEFIVTKSMEGFVRAGLEKDPNKRTWMEAQYLKILTTATKQMGEWGGLDKETASENRLLADYGRSLSDMRAELEKVEGWEAEP